MKRSDDDIRQMAAAMREMGEAQYPHLEAALREAEKQGLNLDNLVGSWTARERFHFAPIIGSSRDLVHRFDRILSRVGVERASEDSN